MLRPVQSHCPAWSILRGPSKQESVQILIIHLKRNRREPATQCSDLDRLFLQTCEG